MDAKTQYAAWVKAIDHAGIIVTIWPLSHEQLKMYIAARVKKYRMTIHADALKQLADFSEGNAILASQTIEKAHLLDEQHITVALIETLVSHDNHYTVFDLSDALLAGNAPRMLAILDYLQQVGTEPTLVLWGITREIRMLIECLIQLKSGQDLQLIFKQHNIIAKKQEVIRRHLPHHSLAICYQWLQQAFFIDQKIKHFLTADAWRELHIFCLRAQT